MINKKKKKNDIKFYVSEEVLEILFDFLKKDQNITKLKAHINKMTLKEDQDINAEADKHPAEYFTQITTKIDQIKKFIGKDFKKLSQKDKKVLADFLYSLEDLASDNAVFPEEGKKTQQGQETKRQPKMQEPLLTLLLIRVLTLPVIEQCQYRYQYDDISNQPKTANINLVQDFNFLEREPLDKGQSTEYGFLNFYPFKDKFTNEEQDAINFHYKIMAKNYFNYLKDVIDNKPNKFFVCYKPGVCQFGSHTGMIEKIFKSEYDKLDKKYKDRMLFCVNSKPINAEWDNGFKYDYTVEDLRKIYPNNTFLSTIKDEDIIYINGVARDAWGKIGNEGRLSANRFTELGTITSTDDKFVRDSNETEQLYGVKIIGGKQTKNKEPLNNLNVKPAEIHIDRTKIIEKRIEGDESNRKLNVLYKGYPLFTSDKKVIIYNKNNKCLTIQPVEDYYKKVKKQQEKERKRHNIDLRDVPQNKVKNNNKKLKTTHISKNNIKI